MTGRLGKWSALAAVAAGLPWALAGEPPQQVTVQPGQAVAITVSSAPAAPDVSLNLGARSGLVTPVRKGCARTGGGNIDVQQPSPDTVVVTLTGVAAAAGAPFHPAEAGLDFELTQAFEVVLDKPGVKAARLTMEARVIGLLRGPGKSGGADESACAGVASDGATHLAVTLPNHAVGGGQNLSVNDKSAPATAVVPAGNYFLSASFHVAAAMPSCTLPCPAPSAEFAPDPALDQVWISPKEPFHGAAKKDFGFQVTLKVAPADDKK